MDKLPKTVIHIESVEREDSNMALHIQGSRESGKSVEKLVRKKEVTEKEFNAS